MSEDFYDVLGVSRDASEDEIQRAFRKKAAEYHPDVSDDPDAEEKFKQVRKAKEVLSDEEKRQAYDRMGHDRFVQAEKHGGFDEGVGAGAGGRAGARGDPFGGGGPFGGDMGDIFEQFFGGMGGQQGRRNRPRKGQDLRTQVELDLEEVYRGVEKEVTVTRPETCPECDGSGHPPSADVRTCPECNGRGQVTQVQQTPFGRVQQTQTCRRCEGEGELYTETCRNCNGDGIVRNRATLTVEIPAGIQDGQTLRMEGEGAPGESGGPKGDLLIDVSIREAGDVERQGDDLHYRVPISFPQATFGDTVEFELFGESYEIDVPSGTQSGETIRLDGEGMPRLRRRGRGDLVVHVQLVTPDPSSLDDEQREALERFAEAGGEEIDLNEGFWQRVKSSF
jgi:molecular chaperone DnaJ